jgi:hypothetical protein
LCGEDEGGVSTFSLGTEIRIMARSVHKNLIRKYQRKKAKKKIWEIFSLCAHYPCSLLLLAVERQQLARVDYEVF